MQNDLNRTSSQVLATYVYTQGIKDGNYSFSTASACLTRSSIWC